MKDRLGEKSENPRRDNANYQGGGKPREMERRACHICKLVGHLAYACPEKGTASDSQKINMGGGDNPPEVKVQDSVDPDNVPKSTTPPSNKRTSDRPSTNKNYEKSWRTRWRKRFRPM